MRVTHFKECIEYFTDPKKEEVRRMHKTILLVTKAVGTIRCLQVIFAAPGGLISRVSPLLGRIVAFIYNIEAIILAQNIEDLYSYGLNDFVSSKMTPEFFASAVLKNTVISHFFTSFFVEYLNRPI